MRNSTKLLLIFFSFLCLSKNYGQSLRAYEHAGNSAFKKRDYAAAASYYAIVLKKKPEKWSMLWKYAESTRLINALKEAEKTYRKIILNEKGIQKYPAAWLRLGQVKKMQGDYTAAIEAFRRFITDSPSDDEFIDFAKKEIIATEQAIVISGMKTDAVEIKHLGREVNSAYSEFAPIIVGDTLYFSSYRFDKKNQEGFTKQKITRVMHSINGASAREPAKGFPVTDSAHIAHTAFSPDGHYIFFTVCKNISASDIRCELWLTVLDRKHKWLPPIKLPEPINQPGYTVTQPSVGYDSLYQGPVLWFASDRPGGKGKLDLWYTPLDTNFFCTCNLPFNGKAINGVPEFEVPINANAINTSENEATPFFSPKDNTLYFSSDGWPGLGGYDIFKSRKDSTVLAEPTNTGAGLNTSYNDLYFFLKEDGVNGYLSSNRTGSYYLDESNKSCCNDIFSFKLLLKEPKIKKDTTQTIAIKKEPVLETPVVEKLIPAPPKFSDFAGLPLYFDNDEPEKRTKKTYTPKTYGETVQTYLSFQAKYRENFSKGSTSPEEDSEVLIDRFFDDEVRRGADRLQDLCEFIYTRLSNGEKIEIVIKGFTSPRAESAYNLSLGKRRISSVRNHFQYYSDGILQNFLQNGQLSIIEASYGETTAKAGISDDLKDERNSIYHPEAARERRVEIVEVKSK